MAKSPAARKRVETELANLRKATDKASAHLQEASRDLAGRLDAMEKMIEKGLTSDDLWDRLEAVGGELESLRLASEKELARLRESSEREFRALFGASSRIARILLSGPESTRKPRRRTAKAKPAAKPSVKRRTARKAKPRPKTGRKS